MTNYTANQNYQADRTSSDKDKALEIAISQIEKNFGKGSIMRLDGDQIADMPSISTGSVSLDIALGIGGVPRGRIIEIFGPESSGKTTLALHIIAEAQKKGGRCVFIDAEHALDPAYAEKLGVKMRGLKKKKAKSNDTDATSTVDIDSKIDVDSKFGLDSNSLLVTQPDDGEQALEITDILVRTGAVDVIVVDSVAALVPRDEIAGEMGDKTIGLQARLMSHALRKLTSSVSKSNCVLIFINQIRMKIGVMFGNPETTTGGNALKFYASVRLDIRRIGSIKEKEDVIGNRTRVKVVKNKVAPPFKVVEFDIMYGEGISKTGELVDLGSKVGIIEKSGSWFAYNNQKIGQGRENAKQYLKENHKIAEEIEEKIKNTKEDIVGFDGSVDAE